MLSSSLNWRSTFLSSGWHRSENATGNGDNRRTHSPNSIKMLCILYVCEGKSWVAEVPSHSSRFKEQWDGDNSHVSHVVVLRGEPSTKSCMWDACLPTKALMIYSFSYFSAGRCRHQKKIKIQCKKTNISLAVSYPSSLSHFRFAQ